MDKNDGKYRSRLAEAIKIVGGDVRASELTGMSVPTIERYRAGKTVPLKVVGVISKAANLSLDWIAYGVEPKYLNEKIEAPEGFTCLQNVYEAAEALKTYIDETHYNFSPKDFAIALQIACKVIEEEGVVDTNFIHNIVKTKGKGIFKLW